MEDVLCLLSLAASWHDGLAGDNVGDFALEPLISDSDPIYLPELVQTGWVNWSYLYIFAEPHVAKLIKAAGLVEIQRLYLLGSIFIIQLSVLLPYGQITKRNIFSSNPLAYSRTLDVVIREILYRRKIRNCDPEPSRSEG